MRSLEYEIKHVDNGWLLTYSVEKEYQRPIYNKRGDLVNHETRTTSEYHTEVFLDVAALCQRLKKLEPST